MRLPSILLCLILLAWALPAAAQNPIERCVGANGSPVFTDQPCAALQATALASNQLVLQMAGDDGSGDPRELRFDIVRHAGCLWLRNTD